MSLQESMQMDQTLTQLYVTISIYINTIFVDIKKSPINKSSFYILCVSTYLKSEKSLNIRE